MVDENGENYSVCYIFVQILETSVSILCMSDQIDDLRLYLEPKNKNFNVPNSVVHWKPSISDFIVTLKNSISDLSKVTTELSEFELMNLIPLSIRLYTKDGHIEMREDEN